MVFQNFEFLLLFLPIFLICYQCTSSTYRKYIVLAFSLVFYAWGEPLGILLLLVLTLFNFFFVKWMDAEEGKKRLFDLIFMIIVNVFVLFYFKYYGWLLDGISQVLPFLTYKKPTMMPLGISFYLFSLLSYVMDVYKHKIQSEKNIVDFACYVTFFPKLIMGPIVRYDDFKQQLPFAKIKWANFEEGIQVFVLGMFFKIVLANPLGFVWMQTQETTSMISAWLGIFAFTLQIYFDFQGYTQMAIGLGKMIGIRLPQNFQDPYVSTSITDFWRRWHKTLSLWFRDYIYIPLGGNRKGTLIQIRNLLVVWLLTGIWHGANLTFLVWGLYYAILLILEKYVLSSLRKKLPTLINWLITFLLVMIGWVFFASDTIQEALQYLSIMFTGDLAIDAIGKVELLNNWWILMLAFLISIRFFTNLWERIKQKFSNWVPLFTVVTMILLWTMILLYQASDTIQSFLYFKF